MRSLLPCVSRTIFHPCIRSNPWIDPGLRMLMTPTPNAYSERLNGLEAGHGASTLADWPVEPVGFDRRGPGPPRRQQREETQVEARTESTAADAASRTAQSLSDIAEQEGFLETSDPALQESADRGEAKLLSYTQLYELWERQQWATQDLDFSRDRIDWHERIEPEERFQRMYGLSAFFIGEQRVTDELGPIMRACPTEEQRIFLSTQIADEARHVRFFNRFYEEVGVLEARRPRRRGCAPPRST